MGNHIITLGLVQAHNGERSEPHNSKLKPTKKADIQDFHSCVSALSFCVRGAKRREKLSFAQKMPPFIQGISYSAALRITPLYFFSVEIKIKISAKNNRILDTDADLTVKSKIPNTKIKAVFCK